MNNSTIFGFASFGIDIGHSAVKIAASMLDTPTLRHNATIPTVVVRAIDLSNEDTARKAAAETVTIDGAAYFFGDTAILQSKSASFSGENQNWINSYVHDVLIVASWQRAMSLIACQPRVIHLALGLPTAFFRAQKTALKDRVMALLTPYLAEGQQLVVLVQEQSAVPLKNRQHTPNGAQNPLYRAESESWAVIDIGHYTTDFSILINSQFQEIGGDSIPGAVGVYAAVRSEFANRGYSKLITQVDAAIKNGTVRHQGTLIDVSAIVAAAIQPLADSIIDRAKMLLGDVAGSLSGIIVSGGIAPLVFERIKSVFPHAILDPIPSMSIAEGLCRFGLYAHYIWADKYRAQNG